MVLVQTRESEVTAVIRELKRFLEDETGPELVEWAIVTVSLVLATFALYQQIGQQVARLLTTIVEALQSIGQ